MRKTLTVVCCLLLLSCLVGQQALFGQQVWITKSFTATLGDFKLNLNDEMRFNESLYYHHIESGLTYWKDFWGVGLNYRKMYIYDEDMPHVNVYLIFKCKRFSFSDRNRLQYMIRRESLTYRKKFKVKYSLFYIADEVFINQGFYRNRFYAGVEYGKVLKIGMFYLLQNTRGKVAHAIGAGLKI